MKIRFPLFAKCYMLYAICVCYGYNVYWANLHSHTELSDGKGTPYQAYLYARDTAHIDILAITDHTHYLTPDEYQDTKSIANQFNVPGQFVAIAGQEFGSLSAFGHFSIFEAESLCSVSVYNLNLTYKWLAHNRLYAQFNHPRAYDFDYIAYNRDGSKSASMIEVVNGSGKYTLFYEDVYITALNQGWHIAPVANQDNHNRKWGNDTTTLGQIPLTGIWALELTKENILDAISKRRVYACEVKPPSDRIYLKNFSVNTTPMGEVCYTRDKNVTINVEVFASNNFANIYLIKNGLIYDSLSPDTINPNHINRTFYDSITLGYYFLKGVQQDGDRFWSAPVWVIYQAPSENVEAWPNPIRGTSQIKFPEVAGADSSEMLVYTIEGKLVYQEYKPSRTGHSWNGRDKNNRLLSNGIYLIAIRVKTQSEEKIFQGKVALLRQ